MTLRAMDRRRVARLARALPGVLALLAGCGDSDKADVAGSLGLARMTDVNPAADIVEVNLVAEAGRMRYLPAGDAEVWGYKDGARAGAVASVPGPLIEANQGDKVIVRFTNNLGEATTIHWHGIRVPNAADGTPSTQKEVAPGGSFVYEFIASDAGTFWYHPHIRGDVQLERGLYGMLVVHGGPEVPVSADRSFVLDDVKLEATGKLSEQTDALDIMLGRQGNVLLVNGQRRGRLDIQRGARERWRFVNAANGRYFNLRLPGHTFTVIGWDGGLVPSPYTAETLLIAPGERYEVLVTLTHKLDGPLAVENIYYDRGHDIPDPGPQALFQVSFTGDAIAPGQLPSTWGSMQAIAVTSTTPAEMIVFREEDSKTPGSEPRFFINDNAFPNVPLISGREGETAIWSVKNDTEMDHPFHLHGMFFQVLDVDGQAPEHSGWKDTVNVPQKKTLRFAVRYGSPGRWMYHCHILEHAERGMMAELILSPPS